MDENETEKLKETPDPRWTSGSEIRITQFTFAQHSPHLNFVSRHVITFDANRVSCMDLSFHASSIWCFGITFLTTFLGCQPIPADWLMAFECIFSKFSKMWGQSSLLEKIRNRAPSILMKWSFLSIFISHISTRKKVKIRDDRDLWSDMQRLSC